jgi:hypothetical protein
MRDLVDTRGAHEYALGFHFDKDVKPEIGEERQWIGDENHRIFTFGDKALWHHKESWVSNNHGKKMNAPFMRFMSSGDGPQEFFTFILPSDKGIAAPKVSEVATTAGRAFIINYSGYSDIFVFNDDPGQSVDNGIFESNFKYSWARISEGGTVPEEFVLVDGNRLNIGGKEIFDKHELNYASARRLGGELYIKTDLGRTKRSLEPQ